MRRSKIGDRASTTSLLMEWFGKMDERRGEEEEAGQAGKIIYKHENQGLNDLH